jgi:hypothetical protein
MRKTATQLLSANAFSGYEIQSWITGASIKELEEFIHIAGEREMPSDFIQQAQTALQLLLAKEALRPHWSVVPNFWVTVLAAIAGIVAAVAAIIPLWPRDAQETKPATATYPNNKTEIPSVASTNLPPPILPKK